MIPKIIHFIWIGDSHKIPSYADFTILHFKDKNPSFDVKFHKFTIDEIISKANSNIEFANILDGAICEQKDRLNDASLQYHSKHMFEKHLICTNINTKISNQLRYYLLNKYGGIYCDLDCYPVKPFDENLLSMKCFFTQHMIHRNSYDIFFIGSELSNFSFDNTLKTVYSPAISSNAINWTEINIFKKYLKSLDDFKILQFIKKHNIDAYVMHPYIGEKFK